MKNSFFLRAAFAPIAAFLCLTVSIGAVADETKPLADSPAFAEAPVSLAELDSSRGGSAFDPSYMNYSAATLAAQSSNNSVIGGMTGNNTINGSFVSSQGLVNVIQNSGNNVIIQSSTIVNMSLSK